MDVRETEYFSTKETREILRISSSTLRNWDKEGKINTIKDIHGRRMYDKQDVLRYIGKSFPFKEKKKIAYCRVSSKKQMEDLERQKNFFNDKYPYYELVTDIGSGINWNRKGFKTILEQSMSGDVQEVVVAHRDRLCRFAFELVEFILNKNNVKLTVLDENTNSKHPHGKSSDTELADDILSIIHVYSCRQMGKRRYSNKNKENENLSDTGTERDIKELDEHVEICIQ